MTQKKVETQKAVLVIPQYSDLTFRLIGPFESPIAADGYVESYFQDGFCYSIEPYNPKIHTVLEEPTE